MIWKVNFIVNKYIVDKKNIKISLKGYLEINESTEIEIKLLEIKLLVTQNCSQFQICYLFTFVGFMNCYLCSSYASKTMRKTRD